MSETDTPAMEPTPGEENLQDLKFWFSDEMPDDLGRALRSRDLDPGEAIITVQSDLSDAGRFGKGWVVLFESNVVAARMNSKGCEISHVLPMEEVSSLEAVNAVGGGTLEAVCRRRRQVLVRYSNARARPMGLFAKKFNELKETGALKRESEEDIPNRCPNCGRVLEEGSTVCERCVRKGRVMLRLVEYAWDYRRYLFVLIILIVAEPLLRLVQPLVTKMLVDGILGAKADPDKFAALRYGARMGMSPLLTVLLIMLLLQVVGIVVGVVRGLIGVFVGASLVDKVRRQLFRHVQLMGLSFFDKYRTGVLMSRIDNDTRAFEQLLIEFVQDMMMAALQLVGIVVILLWLNWKLALLAFLPTPVIVLFSMFIFRKVFPAWHRLRERRARLSAVLNDAISGVRIVKAFAQERREVFRFRTRSRSVRDASIRLGWFFRIVFPWMNFIMHSGVLFIYYFGGSAVLKQQMTLGDLMAYIMYLYMFYDPFGRLIRINQWFTRSASAAQRIFEILDREPEARAEEHRVTPDTINGHVEFDGVVFGYDPLKPVLRGIDLDVKAGEMIGLVGHSGVGKTTMTNLIINFYSVDEGTISIDGVPIDRIRHESLRRQIGVVPQDCYLFSDSVAENIAYAKSDATRSDIIRAAIAANAHDFIMQLSDGYDTNVGERGGRLSAGQRQRIAIARAILHDPRILILDEATSSVDTDTEDLIQQALARLVKDRTTFAIAHRLSTLKNADRLVVLKNGKIEEVGTHRELLARKGEYWRLVQMQSKLSKLSTIGG